MLLRPSMLLMFEPFLWEKTVLRFDYLSFASSFLDNYSLRVKWEGPFWPWVGICVLPVAIVQAKVLICNFYSCSYSSCLAWVVIGAQVPRQISSTRDSTSSLLKHSGGQLIPLGRWPVPCESFNSTFSFIIGLKLLLLVWSPAYYF